MTYIWIGLAFFGPFVGWLFGDIAVDNNNPLGVWVGLAWVGVCSTAAAYYNQIAWEERKAKKK